MSTKAGSAPKAKEPGYYYVQKVYSGETFLVLAKSSIEIEDEYTSLYYTSDNPGQLLLQPPYDPATLLNLAQTNNILNQCIEAMEVNISGTGYEFVQKDDKTQIDPDEVRQARDFFNETCPNTSFTAQSRLMTLQRESIGYTFLEVLRNMAGDIVGLRSINTHNIRMAKLDAPIRVTKTVTRGGKDFKMDMWVRERRFAQRVALKSLVFYKEFGASRELSRTTGEWETNDVKIPPEDRATELIYWPLRPDIFTPYAVPRWINEMPSVVGSRKAEIQNLEFLDAGGMPPAIIFIQGGTLAKDAADQLRAYLSGQNKNKNRAVVVEAQSSSGSLEQAGTVKVSVERFGAERAMDAMFMKYDASTEEHVRVGFRLPPLFLGKAADFNFATAVTAYMVAEAQVFQPERQAFDELINMTIMKEMGWKTIKFQSKPITLKDVANQMEALKNAKDVATRDSFIKEINKVTGLNLVLDPTPQPDTVTMTADGTSRQVPTNPDQVKAQNDHRMEQAGRMGLLPQPQRGTLQRPEFQPGIPHLALPEPSGGPTKAKTPGTGPQAPKAGVKGKKTAMELITLAHDFAKMKGLIKKKELSPERALLLKEEIDGLDAEDQAALNDLLATYTFNSNDPDLQLIASQASKMEPYQETV